MTKFNVTQLNIDKELEKHIFHPDRWAHLFRWTYVLKISKIGNRVLDFGCGSGNLLELLYRNRHRCSEYLGIEYKKGMVEKCTEKWKAISWASFKQQDLTLLDFNYGNNWDIIVSFELIEHISKKNGAQFLDNVKRHMNENTVFLLSTPCFNGKAAKNHVIDGEVGEFTYNEIKQLLSERFIIEDCWGTFGSQREYIPYMNDWQKKYFEKAKEYYDSTVLSIIMAPLFPEHARNVIWRCKLK